MSDRSGSDRIAGSDKIILNAYVDGVLPEPQMREFEEKLKRSPAAQAYVAASKRLNELGRISLERAAVRPIPRGLESALEEFENQKDSSARRTYLNHPFFAMAASLGLMAIGYFLGFFSAERGIQQQMLTVDALMEQTRSEVRSELNRVLEYTPSGTRVSWESDRHNVSAVLLPVRTLKTQDKHYCREFKETLLIDGVREERHGLSCRVGKERWETRMILPNDNKNTF